MAIQDEIWVEDLVGRFTSDDAERIVAREVPTKLFQFFGNGILSGLL